jgi:hypothetical protein
MKHLTSDHDEGGTESRRSRRAMLAGGAAGALGAIGFEALANTPQAQAATTTTVVKVSAGDASIVVGGTTARPTIETGTLDKIASLHPPAAPVNFNGQKGTNMANGSAATDAAAFGQLPSSSSPLPLNEGGTGRSESSPGGLLASLGGLPEAGGALTGGFAPAVVALSPSGGSVAVDASQGNVFTLSLTGSGWTITNPVNPIGDGQVIRIRLSQDSAGGRAVSWDTAYDWGSSGGTANGAPTLSTAAGATDILGFEYVAALSKWCSLGAAFPQGF